MKPYIPKLTNEFINKSEQKFRERSRYYLEKGIDLTKTREDMIRFAKFSQGKVLEIGTGGGYSTLVLASLGFKVISIDPDSEMIDMSAARIHSRNLIDQVMFYQMDGAKTNFGDHEFSNIVVINLFHHIKDINQMLSEIDRILAPSGKVLIADLNQAGMEVVDNMHAAEGRLHENHHITEECVRSYFTSLNYDVIRYPDKHHWVLLVTK